MPDEPSAPASPQSGNDGGQPGNAGNDFVQVPREQLEKFQRREEQWKGVQPFIEKHQKLGIRRPEDFDKFRRVDDEPVSDRDLERLFSPQSPDDAPLTQKQLQKILEEREGKLKSEHSRSLAESEYQRLLEQERDLFKGSRDELVKELLGDEPDPWASFLLDNALDSMAWEHRQQFDDDHPLRQDKVYRPMSRDEFGAFRQKLVAKKNEILSKSLAEIGDAAGKQASKPPASPPAGRGQGQGKADAEPKKPFDQLDPKDQQAWLDKRREQRKGAASA